MPWQILVGHVGLLEMRQHGGVDAAACILETNEALQSVPTQLGVVECDRAWI